MNNAVVKFGLNKSELGFWAFDQYMHANLFKIFHRFEMYFFGEKFIRILYKGNDLISLFSTSRLV